MLKIIAATRLLHLPRISATREDGVGCDMVVNGLLENGWQIRIKSLFGGMAAVPGELSDS